MALRRVRFVPEDPDEPSHSPPPRRDGHVPACRGRLRTVARALIVYGGSLQITSGSRSPVAKIKLRTELPL